MFMWGIEGSERMVDAAVRTLEREERSRGMNLTVVEGERDWMVSIVGWIRERERPRRMSWDGLLWARVMAVSAPMPPLLGPVMRTFGCVSERLWGGRVEETYWCAPLLGHGTHGRARGLLSRIRIWTLYGLFNIEYLWVVLEF